MYIATVFSCTFSIGYRFYYWQYYKHDETRHDNHYIEDKLLNRSALYISKKYNDLKQEILSNNHLTLNIAQYATCVTKAEKYENTATVRRNATICDDLHYEIEVGSILSKDHLLAIIFYTDYSELSTKFTASFRRVNFYDSLDRIKQTNQEYAIWSRLLREAVENWGSIGWNQNKSKKWNLEHNRVRAILLWYEFCYDPS